MACYIRLYEFSIETPQKQIGNEHTGHIIELYRWRRRSQQSIDKLRATRWVITQQPTQSQVSDLLVQDIDYVLSQIEKYQGMLEPMVPILTYLALVFLPLSYGASIFSMNDDFVVNSSRFWIYLVTALPLLILVLILSSVSFQWTEGMGGKTLAVTTLSNDKSVDAFTKDG